MSTVHKPKKVIENQQYDNYWKLTVEYTDIYDSKFNNTLKIIISFIDNYKLYEIPYSRKHYGMLQNIIYNVYEKSDMASVRKSINQFIKLGFVLPLLKGYHPLAKKFLNSSTKEEKRLIFSKIFYESSTFSSSVTNDYTSIREINFLLKTLTYHPNMFLTKKDIIALMVTPNINGILKGYLTADELKEQYKFSETISFEEKKYNQIGYMFNFLNHMDNIISDKDRGVGFIDKTKISIDTRRDPYLYSVFKTELKNESSKIYGNEICFIKKKPYASLVASHIKDSAVCLKNGELEAAYDSNNGLLLSPDIDAYFDHYLISFDDDGTILINTKKITDASILEELRGYKLDPIIMNMHRKKYMSWHRNQFYEKLKS